VVTFWIFLSLDITLIASTIGILEVLSGKYNLFFRIDFQNKTEIGDFTVKSKIHFVLVLAFKVCVIKITFLS